MLNVLFEYVFVISVDIHFWKEKRKSGQIKWLSTFSFLPTHAVTSIVVFINHNLWHANKKSFIIIPGKKAHLSETDLIVLWPGFM